MTADLTCPAHRPTVDFDHHHPDYPQKSAEVFRALRTGCPVAWSEQHGGFWVVTRHTDISKIARDPERFSSDFDPDGSGSGYGGVHIPPHPREYGRFVPEECDPPENIALRKMVTPALLSQAVVNSLEPAVTDFVTYCIDRRIESGEIDLVLDLASPVPAMLTRHMLGMPLEGWESWAEPMHELIAQRPGTPRHDAALQGAAALIGDLGPLIAERRAKPGDDIVSRIVSGAVDGAPLSDEVVTSFLFTLIAGGVDTTTSLMGHSFVWLDEHPDDRRRLVEDPALIPIACEEFLRWSSPNNAVARTATADTELDGHLIRQGERVLISFASANRDEEVFDRPEEFILDRAPNKHLAFGEGTHRCLGANIARMEFAVIMREVLRRIPDFKLVPGGAERYPETCVIDGYIEMPATFTPGTKLGVSGPMKGKMPS